ncbi:hypothetical protein [Microbacterium sp.]|uniref:hypothetical protein n=1 Tax=Microbacterium sp. TaxID=51671 RepID=UPI003F72CA10
MIDRAHTEAVTYRVAVSALTYRSDKPEHEPGYTVEEDVDWCIQPLRGIPTDTFERLRALVRDTIIDPTANREALAHSLSEAAIDSGGAQS